MASKYSAAKSEEYLQNAYDAHFLGRRKCSLLTYLTITRKVDRSRFYVHNEKSLISFKILVTKVFDILADAALNPTLLNREEIDRYIGRFLSMDFSSVNIKRNNFSVQDNQIDIGNSSLRCI
ncbi:MAG: conjugal transfer protein TraG, partial [Pedobacter sp.]